MPSLIALSARAVTLSLGSVDRDTNSAVSPRGLIYTVAARAFEPIMCFLEAHPIDRAEA
jgi:hypothetical protein